MKNIFADNWDFVAVRKGDIDFCEPAVKSFDPQFYYLVFYPFGLGCGAGGEPVRIYSDAIVEIDLPSQIVKTKRDTYSLGEMGPNCRFYMTQHIKCMETLGIIVKI